ncbi:MAG TPA: hypothetical protein VFH77_14185 [Streptomyces sp.]|nr:hypothetical protein [Streptomyces sp.]
MSEPTEPTTPPAGAPQEPAAPPAADPPKPTPPPATPEPAPETDWKAEARKWEKRAKENNTAVTELEQLKAAQMTEQEKAVAEAESRGRTAAASEYGRQLAAARFEAAAATAGVQLGDAAGLIDVGRFVGDDGQVDADAIQAAVTQLAAIAPKPGPGRSGADLSGGHGDQPPSVDKQIAEARANGDWRTVMRLENSKLPGLAAQNQ